MDGNQLHQIIGSDDRVLGIEWTDDGLSVIIRVRAYDRGSEAVLRDAFAPTVDWHIRFDEVRALCISVDFGMHSGFPLLWDVLETKLDNGIRVVMEFGAAPEGMISLECASYVLTKEQRPPTR